MSLKTFRALILLMVEVLKDINVPTIYEAGLAIQAEYCGSMQGTEKQLDC